MATRKISVVLKSIGLISFLFLFIYSALPFVNGIGCDFRSQVDDEDASLYTTCKFGWLTTIAKSKINDEVIQYQGIYGKSGDTAIFLAFDISQLEPGHIQDMPPVSSLAKSHLYISKMVVIDGHDWILLGYPFSRVHKAKRIGPLGFW